MFRTLSPGDSISVFLRKLLQRGRRGSQAIYKFATKGAGSLNIWTSEIRYQVKKFSILYMGRCKPLGSLNSFLSYASQPSGASLVFLFTLLLVFPQLLSSHCKGWQHLLDHNFGSPHSYIEARNCWWLCHFLLINMSGNIFISHQVHGFCRNYSTLLLYCKSSHRKYKEMNMTVLQQNFTENT